MVTDFDKKTVGYCAAMSVASAAVSGLSVAAGPALLVGFAGGAGVLWLRQRMFSLQGTYNQDLEVELREKTHEGFCFTQMGRFHEEIDLAEALTPAMSSQPSTALVVATRTPKSPSLPMKLPQYFADCGILLKLERRVPGTDSSPEMVKANVQWLRVQYSKDGLAYRKVTPPFPNTRWQRLEDVRPFDLAQSLYKKKDSTFNAMTWNAYSVMEMIWTEMEQRSSENISASQELCQSRESRKDAECCYQRSICT